MMCLQKRCWNEKSEICAQIILQNRIRITILQATFQNIVGLLIVGFHLLAFVCQAIHSQAAVEAHLVNSMLPLDFDVVFWRCYSNTVINNPAIPQVLLKKRLRVEVFTKSAFVHSEPLSVWASRIGNGKTLSAFSESRANCMYCVHHTFP